MFEYLKMSNIDDNGIERCFAYSDFTLDNTGVWQGAYYMLINNHKKTNVGNCKD